VKRIFLLFVLLLIVACDNPIQPQTNEIRSISIELESEYAANIQEDIGGCIIAITPIVSLLAKFSRDQSIINNFQWVASSKITLIIINDHCGNMGWVVDVPQEYQEPNEYLLNANSKFREFVIMYREGIKQNNPSLIIKSTSLLDDGATYLRQFSNYMNYKNRVIYLYR
jgi:hypothetical protein